MNSSLYFVRARSLGKFALAHIAFLLLHHVPIQTVHAGEPMPAGTLDVDQLVETCWVGSHDLERLRELPESYDRVLKGCLSIDRIRIAYSEADVGYFLAAAEVADLLVAADRGREWIHGLVIDALAELNQVSPPASEWKAEPLSQPHPTATELDWRRERNKRIKLLRELIQNIIHSFRKVKDCRLANDLTAAIGYHEAIDRESLNYMRAACRGDTELAERVYRAVVALGTMERSMHLEAALELASAARVTTGYLSPADRITRLWHAPVGRRELDDDETRELGVVLQFPEVHVAAMSDLFRSLDWQGADFTRTRLQVLGMLAILEAMPSAEYRGLLAEWFLFVDDGVPAGSRARAPIGSLASESAQAWLTIDKASWL